MKSIAALFLALGASACFAQDSATPITCKIRAARLPVALAELSQLSGLQLECSQSISAEVVAIKVDQLPMKDLMQRIAEVTAGEWRQEGDVYRLLESSNARARESREETARRAAAIQRLITKRLDQLKKAEATPTKPDPAKASQQADLAAAELMRSASPEEKVITRLLEGIDPSVLGAMGTNERDVFSTSPTHMQRSLGQNSGDVLDEFVKEHNKNATAAPPEEGNPEMAAVPDYFKDMIKMQTARITSASKVLLVVSKTNMGMGGMTQVELRFFDPKGDIEYKTQSFLENPMDTLAEQGISVPGMPAPAKTGQQTPIELTPESKEFLAMLNKSETGSTDAKLTPALKTAILQPDKSDPLSYFATDAVFALARSKNMPLVADLPDGLGFSLGAFATNASPTVEQFEKSLQKGDVAIESSASGCLEIVPANPIEDRSLRADRSALAQLLKKSTAGLPSLDDLAAYAETSPSPMENPLEMIYLMDFVPGSIMQSMTGGLTNWEMLRLYGTLDQAQKSDLLAGGRLAFGNMTPAQQTDVQKLTYGADAQIREDSSGKSDQEDLPFFMSFMESMAKSFRQEPTEAAPSGLPPQAFLTLKATTEPFANVVDSGGAASFSPLSIVGPDELALFKMFKTDPKLSAAGSAIPSLGKVKVGQRTVYTFKFRLATNSYVQSALNDNRLPDDAPVISSDNLPADFQKTIDERLAALKKSPMGSIGAMMAAFGKQSINP